MALAGCLRPFPSPPPTAEPLKRLDPVLSLSAPRPQAGARCWLSDRTCRVPPSPAETGSLHTSPRAWQRACDVVSCLILLHCLCGRQTGSHGPDGSAHLPAILSAIVVVLLILGAGLYLLCSRRRKQSLEPGGGRCTCPSRAHVPPPPPTDPQLPSPCVLLLRDVPAEGWWVWA